MQILDKVNVVVQRISAIRCKTAVCFTLQQRQGIYRYRICRKDAEMKRQPVSLECLQYKKSHARGD